VALREPIPRSNHRIVIEGDGEKEDRHDASTVRRLHDIGETVAHDDEDGPGRKVLDNAGNTSAPSTGLMVDDARTGAVPSVECAVPSSSGHHHMLISVGDADYQHRRRRRQPSIAGVSICAVPHATIRTSSRTWMSATAVRSTDTTAIHRTGMMVLAPALLVPQPLVVGACGTGWHGTPM